MRIFEIYGNAAGKDGATEKDRLDKTDMISVGGVLRPRKNSLDEPIHQTDTGIRNFWSWFGDSKAVDVWGRPLVVYHGSMRPNLKKFIASYKRKTEKTNRMGYNSGQAGIFFSTSKDIAEFYGRGYVGEYYLRIENPLWYKDYYLTMLTAGDVDVLQNDLGHDGYISSPGRGEYVVFDGKQVKSVYKNTGDFSKKSSLIKK